MVREELEIRGDLEQQDKVDQQVMLGNPDKQAATELPEMVPLVELVEMEGPTLQVT